MTIQSTTVGGTTYTPTFHDNEATNGGGIYVGDGCSLTMSASDIYKNMASNYGGGVYVTSGGTLSMSAGSIGKSGTGNANTANKGGGVYVAGGTFNLSGGNVQYNTVAGSDKFGAGIYLSSGTVSMTGGTVNNNTGATSGGGVYMAGGTFNLSDGYISHNSTSGYGGGVRLEGGTLAMSGGQIVNNTSSSSGGGVYKKDGTLRVTGAPVIKDNSLYDVFLNNATANNRHILIGAAGLECGAEIGVSKTTTGDYKIAEAEGSNAAANANYAMRNGFFFDDASTPKAVCSKTSSPWYDLSSSTLYFASPSNTAWDQASVPASGYSVSGSGSNRRVTISTAQGLAYFAHQVNTNTDNYEGATVELTDDVNLSGKTWVPIGYMTECDRDPSAPEGFKGTFDGKGHTIYNVTCDHPFYDNAGLFGIVRGGTVKNLMVSGTITNASANLGGIVGEMIGGSVYNCMSSVTPTGGTNRGALVGKIANSGSLYNSFANSSSPLVGNNAGTVANCYVRGASSLVTTGTANYCYASSGSASGTNGTFSAVETTRPYSYNCFDNQVTATNTYVPTTTTANPDKQLVTTLNNWVAAQTTPNDYAGWVRPTTPRINGDYPILKMPGSDAVASNGDGNVLHYGAVSGSGNLLSTYTTASYAICLYNSVSTVASNSGRSAEFYINEDVAIGSGSGVNAHVGITLKDAAWHMFSPAIAAAPLGITYTDNTTDYGYNDPLPQVSFNTSEDGYFPHTDINGNSYYDSWDYYCYYEPEYHWINFKRNSNSHHHEDGNHEHINYTNETTLIPAKGYLLGTKLQTFLQAEGTLNDGNVSIALTSQSPLRTGYNFIGNPYQAYLDFDAFAEYTSNLGIWEGNDVTKASYVILESSGYMSYVHGASDNHFGADRYLHPHQGFMVVVKNGASRAYFTNGMRSITNTAAFRDEQINYPLVNLIATEADGKRDITTVELGRPDQGGALKQYDLHLGKGSIYTHYGDDDYAIAFTQPGISEVGIRFETDEDATYTLSWDTENGEFSYLHLIDNITGIDTDCLTTSEYRFAAKTSDYKSRFKLVFGYTGVEENEDGASTGSATFAFLMGNELVVNCGPSTSSGTATLQMFDLMGRMMMERQVSGTQASIMMPDMPAGVYVLRLSGNNGTRTQKIVME